MAAARAAASATTASGQARQSGPRPGRVISKPQNPQYWSKGPATP
jgi:hypothetical protein